MRKKSVLERLKLKLYKNDLEGIVYDYSVDNNMLYVNLHMALKNGSYVPLKCLGVWSEELIQSLEQEGIKTKYQMEKDVSLRLEKK